MNVRGLPCLLAVAVILGSAERLSAQVPAGPPRAWQVEVLGGVQAVAAEDLNAQVESDTARLDFSR